MSSQEESTNQPNTPLNEKEIQNLDLSCKQLNNINDTSKSSDIGADGVTEESPRSFESENLNSVKGTKENRIKTIVDEFFQEKQTHYGLLGKTTEFNLNAEEKHILWNIINFKIKNETMNNGTEVISQKIQQNTDPKMQTLQEMSLAVVKSCGNGLCLESESGQISNVQYDSKIHLQKAAESCDSNLPIDNKDHQNIDSQYDPKTHSEEPIELCKNILPIGNIDHQNLDCQYEHSQEATASCDSNLLIEKKDHQNLDSQHDSKIHSEETIELCDSNLAIENNDHQNLDLQYDSKTHSQELMELCKNILPIEKINHQNLDSKYESRIHSQKSTESSDSNLLIENKHRQNFDSQYDSKIHSQEAIKTFSSNLPMQINDQQTLVFKQYDSKTNSLGPVELCKNILPKENIDRQNLDSQHESKIQSQKSTESCNSNLPIENIDYQNLDSQYDSKTLSEEAKESCDNNLATENNNQQSLGFQSDSNTHSQETIESCDNNLPINNLAMENKDQRNTNSQYDSKDQSQEVEVIQIGLSAAEENEILEFIAGVEKETSEVDISDEEVDSDGNNDLDKQIDSPRFNHYLKQRDLIKEKREYSQPHKEIIDKGNENIIYSDKLNKNDHESSTRLENFGNSTDREICTKSTQGRVNKKEEDSWSSNWEVRGDEVVYSMNVNNSDKQVSDEDEGNHNFLKQSGQKYRGVKHPMNDKYGKFFINRSYVDVDLYQDGLLYKKWNPVQSLYEISNQCNWGPPEFKDLPYDMGFLFSVKVNGHEFNSQKRAASKKKAKYFASAYILQYLGFKINYENDKDTGGSSSDSDWRKRVKEDNLKDNSKFATEIYPYSIQPLKSNNLSTKSDGCWDLRNVLNKRKQSCSSESGKSSQYNKEKPHSSWKTSEDQTINLNEYKKRPRITFKNSSNHSSSYESKRTFQYKGGHEKSCSYYKLETHYNELDYHQDQDSSVESKSTPKYKRVHSPESKYKNSYNRDSHSSKILKPDTSTAYVQPTVKRYKIDRRPIQNYNTSK